MAVGVHGILFVVSLGDIEKEDIVGLVRRMGGKW